jgi:hypothetical protein
MKAPFVDLSFPAPRVLGELLDELEKTGVADRLGGLDLLHLAVEGGPAHAMGLVDRIANAAVRSETLAALERLTDGTIVGTLALAAVGQAMGLAGGEECASSGLVELRHEIPALGADPPPAPAAQGLGRGRQLHGVVMLGGLAGPMVRGGVGQANPAALPAHMRLVADAGSLLSGIGVGPRQRS